MNKKVLNEMHYSKSKIVDVEIALVQGTSSYAFDINNVPFDVKYAKVDYAYNILDEDAKDSFVGHSFTVKSGIFGETNTLAVMNKIQHVQVSSADGSIDIFYADGFDMSKAASFIFPQKLTFKGTYNISVVDLSAITNGRLFLKFFFYGD